MIPNPFLRRQSRTFVSQPAPGRTPRYRHRPQVEQLEPRQLLSLTINATFDSTITNDPNAATIEGTINAAVQAIENSISDPITVNITFQEESTSLGNSGWVYITGLPYSTYRAALASHATSAADMTALASLPTGP